MADVEPTPESASAAPSRRMSVALGISTALLGTLIAFAVYRATMPFGISPHRDSAAIGWAYVKVDEVTAIGAAPRRSEDGAQPSPHILPYIRSMMPHQVLLGGATLSLLFGVAVATLPLMRQRRREQRTYLRLALEAAAVGMVMIDRNGTMAFVNAHLLEIFGHSREDLLGRGVEMLVPELAPTFRAALRSELITNPSARTMAAGKESYGLRKDGGEVPIEVGLNPIQTFDGRFLLASIVDLTERKRSEQVQRQMSALIESAADAILTEDLRGIVRSWNPAARLLLGYSEQEMVGQPMMRLLPDDRQEEEDMFLERMQRGEKVTDFETVRKRKDGSLVEVSLTISSIHDASGAVIGASKIMRDITERRRATEQFRLALEAAPTGMLMMNRAGTIVLVNRQIEKIFGYRREQVLGQSIEVLLPGRFRTKHAGMRSAGPSSETVGLHRNGKEVPVEIMINPLKTGNEEFVLSSIVDLSQRREIEKLRTDFVSTVSHELRTPLTSISGSLGLVCSGAMGRLPDEAAAMIRIAHKNSGRLVRIINDILDVGKLEAGQVTLNLTSVPLAELLRQAIEANASLAETYQVKFLLDVSSGDGIAHADPDRLMQVITNLLSNAAKVSPRGADIVLRVLPQGATLRVEVEDHGPGISETFKARIFEKFAQADASDTRRLGGSGLGLSISRQLMELMNGSIGFDTVAGHGSIFHIELHRAPVQRSSGGLAAFSSA